LNKKVVVLLVVSVVIAIIDQWSKYVIDTRFALGEVVPVIKGFFNLTYVRNSGAAFGFGGAFNDWIRIGLFKIIPVVAIIWLTVLLITKKEDNFLIKTSYSLIIGGAIGNIIDRIRLDYVVDMFDFYYGKSHFATFNVADAAISVAAGLLIIDYFQNYIHERKSKQVTE
jgi:signal peptidase II